MTNGYIKEAESIIARLHKLARNIWWTWTPRAQDIFLELAEQKWHTSNHNAVAVLNSTSDQELRARLCDKDFAERVVKVLDEFEYYMSREDTWCVKHAPELFEHPVAYFSMEFGLHECLPIYSGGLGVLAGDHAKSASDLGVPLYGISLFYRYGYFKQSIQPDGWQQESYPSIDPGEIPVELVVDENGEPVTAEVEIAHSKVTFHAWRINVGRVTIYLLDTDRPENELHHRDITAHVYGGDSTTRIMQEIVLGVGGVRFLRKIGVEPGVFHMNEGHPAFLTIELLREKITEGLPREEAQAWVKDRCTFTTHTPVPAGHDRFSRDLMEYIMAGFLKSLDVDLRELMSLGRVNPDDPEEPFCMTVLALKLSRSANAVSELHGRVSREMWKDVFKTDNPDTVPIGHVTNGVHSLGWMTNRTRNFWQRHLGSKWIYYLKNPIIWEQVSDPELISDEEIWAFRYALRRDLIEFVRRKLKSYYQKQGTDFRQVADKVLSPDVLTIGFARRFATYKRAPLLFRYFEEVLPLFTDEKRPIQIIFAGKAHPRDDAGKRYIQEIVGYAKNPLLFGRVVFLENYDINIARHMISGVDVWLNTPRRPLEASGTSGMKIAVHGGINCSILDGWWREGYSGDNGFAIGDDGGVVEPEKQDEIDAVNLLKVLTDQVIPEFYDRDETGIPRKWIQRMRRSMTSLIPVFNTDRMVAEYVQKYYLKR